MLILRLLVLRQRDMAVLSVVVQIPRLRSIRDLKSRLRAPGLDDNDLGLVLTRVMVSDELVRRCPVFRCNPIGDSRVGRYVGILLMTPTWCSVLTQLATAPPEMLTFKLSLTDSTLVRADLPCVSDESKVSIPIGLCPILLVSEMLDL